MCVFAPTIVCARKTFRLMRTQRPWRKKESARDRLITTLFHRDRENNKFPPSFIYIFSLLSLSLSLFVHARLRVMAKQDLCFCQVGEEEHPLCLLCSWPSMGRWSMWKLSCDEQQKGSSNSSMDWTAPSMRKRAHTEHKKHSYFLL